MTRDWSRSAQDDFLVDPRLARVSRPAAADFGSLSPGSGLGLPALSVVAGVMATLLYVWPLLLIVDILAGGFPEELFGWILMGSACLASLMFWAITAVERRYWAGRRHSLGDFADPPTWK